MSLRDHVASAVWLIALSVAQTTGGAFALSIRCIVCLPGKHVKKIMRLLAIIFRAMLAPL